MTELLKEINPKLSLYKYVLHVCSILGYLANSLRDIAVLTFI